MTLWAWIPLVGVLVVLALGCVWRPWLQARRYGSSGLFLFQSGGRAQRVRDGVALLLPVLLVAQAVCAGVSPAAVRPIVGTFPPAPFLRAIGIVLMIAGVTLLVAAQVNLGASWRVGIEERARPGLVTTGFYRYSRNPIFTALIMAIAGYAVLLPTRLSLILLAAAYIGIRLQISVEEAYLVDAYGDAYRAYGSRVGRLLPGIGHFR